MAKRRLQVLVFLTWDVSLALLHDKGLLEREISLYRELARRGVDTTFISWGGREDRAVADTLGEGLRCVPMYERMPRFKNALLRGGCSLFAPWVLRRELRQADILKTHQMWGGWVAALCKWFSRKPLIVRHTLELYDYTLRQGVKGLHRALVRLTSKMTYAAGDHICLATEEDRDAVIEHFDQLPSKISLHPHWVDTSFFKPEVLPENENSVLFAGRLTVQKNLEMLIEALAGTPYKLVLVGDGPLRGALENAAKDKSVDVTFTGNLPQQELPRLYNSYPVFVMPSLAEGNPKALLEAMACGRAVVGTDVEGISTVIAHEETGWLCALNPNALKASIATLMEDKALRKALGTAARRQIEENQTLDSLVAKELACYRSLWRPPQKARAGRFWRRFFEVETQS